MSDLLLEIFSEEIPARMQVQAAKDLERLVVGALSDRGLLFEAVKAFSGPRRLTLAIAGLPAKQPDVSEEKKGPRLNAPAKAIEGFLRSAGVTLEECEKRDDGKGEFYVAVINRQGRPTIEVLAELLPEAMAKLPWPKSMRWGTAGATRWVRPLHSIVATLEGEVIPFTYANIASGNKTLGHRFLSSGELTVRRFEDYEAALKKAHVILDAEERKARIYNELKQAAFVHGLELIEDEGLLNEVAGLAEWPVVLIGKIQDEFMDVPAEILQTSMRTHQKYFALSFGAPDGAPQDDASGGASKQTGSRHAEVRAKGEPRSMAPRFAVVSNMVATDGGKEIIAGNERVLRARLSDAKFFWDQDRKTKLEARVDALKDIVFHAKLGTQYERVERIETLAGEIAEKIGADPKKAKRAARLCKADLTTGVVGEFPELQGVMGRYYALHDGEDSEVADAVRDHYKPQGPSDAVPTNKVSIAVALADKLDAVVSFFSFGEKPSGSGDPFALRRACLGILRILLENNLRASLRDFMKSAVVGFRLVALERFIESGPLGAYRMTHKGDHDTCLYEAVKLDDGYVGILGSAEARRVAKEASIDRPIWLLDAGRVDGKLVVSERLAKNFAEADLPPVLLGADLLPFFGDRLKVALREKGTRHDLIDAVFSLGNEDDLVRLVARVEALQSFLKTDDGTNLLAGYKRAANILKAEEKKDSKTYDGTVDAARLAEPEDKAFAAALDQAKSAVTPALAKENFEAAMRAMAALRAPVDAFFDKVKVNADDKSLRENRLQLLASLRATLHTIADFSKIEG